MRIDRLRIFVYAALRMDKKQQNKVENALRHGARSVILTFRVNRAELARLRRQAGCARGTSPHAVARAFILNHLGLAA